MDFVGPWRSSVPVHELEQGARLRARSKRPATLNQRRVYAIRRTDNGRRRGHTDFFRNMS